MTQKLFFQIEIDEFDFSNRVYKSLIKKHIHTMGDLKNKTACDLGFSSKSSYVGAKEFATKLGKRGLRLKEDRQHLDNVMAVMLGHAIADAMGVPVEFMNRKELSVNPVTGYRGYGTHSVPAGTWSDDTSMALATLDSLTHGLDYTDMMQRFCNWKTKAAYTATDEVFDMGTTTNDALCRFLKGVDPLKCGSSGKNDNGNGSLMRIIPAILYCNCLYSDTTMEERMCIIHNISALTHAHPRSQIGCGIYAVIMSNLLASKSKSSIGKSLLKAKSFYEKQPEFFADLAHYARLFDHGFYELPESEIRSSGYVVDTLEAAIWCVLNTESYTECVLKAVNLGRDTDTVAAVAGGLAAAIYGLQGIPQEWQNNLRRKEMIVGFCKKFVDTQNTSPNLLYDESRISLNIEREQQNCVKRRNYHIKEFAQRMLYKFQDTDTREEEVASFDTFASICLAFGFTIDLQSLGSAYRKAFGDDTLAHYDALAFSRIAYKIHDAYTLGSVIFFNWRRITHWSGERLLSEKNRPWFIAAFERLMEITTDPPVTRNPFHYLIDVHGHYLFGIDDGALNIEMSVQMIRKAYEQGVREIICTSHSWGYNEKYKQNLTQLQLMLKKEKIDVRIYPGTEIACSYRAMPVIIEQLKDEHLHPIGKSKYVLLEFDSHVRSSEIKSCLKYMHSCKFQPIIAHVERYYCLHADENTLDLLQNCNIPLQINAYSLVEEKNEEIRNFARKLLAEKRVTFVGSDAHRLEHRPPNVLSGIEFIYENCASDYADNICYKNAERILLIK